MTDAIKFATSKPKYKNRQIDWYSVWDEFDDWNRWGAAWKEQKLYIERLVIKQLAGKK